MKAEYLASKISQQIKVMIFARSQSLNWRNNANSTNEVEICMIKTSSFLATRSCLNDIEE